MAFKKIRTSVSPSISKVPRRQALHSAPEGANPALIFELFDMPSISFSSDLTEYVSGGVKM